MRSSPRARARSRRLPLRVRLGLSFGAAGFVFSLLFAVSVFAIAERYEHILIAEVLRAEADQFRERLGVEPATTLPSGPHLRGYRLAGDGDALPAALRTLPDGVHEIGDDDGVHAAAFEIDGERFVFVIDTGEIDALERFLWRILAVIVVIGAGLSAALGAWMAATGLRPLQRLVEAVDALLPQPAVTRLAEREADDELGRLAAAIDRYQRRLLDADQQQRRFFAEASHALRTPIAVVRGALELLHDDEVPASQRRPLARIDRAVDELAALLQSLLLVARGAPAAAENVDLPALIGEAVDAHRSYAASRGVRLELDVADAGGEGGAVLVDRAWAAALLACLVRAAIDAAGNGELRIRWHAGGVEIEAGDGDASGAAAGGDRGLALQLAARLAAGLGWRLNGGPPFRLDRLRVDHVGVEPRPTAPAG